MEMMFLIFFATMSFSFGLSYWATFDKLKKSNLLLAELFIKTRALEKLNSQIDNGISDSRDWAFEYIEKSQQTIKEVSDELRIKGLDNYSEKLLALLPEINQEKK